MRHKILFLIFFGICLAESSLFAQHVTEAEAREKATSFLQGKHITALVDASQMRRAQGRTLSTDAYYIFNVEKDGGFVIVSGDDRTKEILAYSDNGSFDLQKAPSNVKWLLDYYEQVITNLDPIQQRRSATGMRKAPQREEVAPFITTTWGQGAPYNSQCPTVDDENCLTGCVATAMAQVMNYMKCPGGETGAIGGYTAGSLNLWVDGLAPTSFDWDNMTDDDIARLMRYCGQAVQMDYGLDMSGAMVFNVPYAMQSFFGFDNSLWFVYASDISADAWIELIYREISNGRPVILGGGDDLDKHAFICNGYQDGLFYINWGWDGYFDGYFELELLSPIPSSDYSKDLLAVINIQKSLRGEEADGAGRIFTANSPEGIEVKFSVISESAKTCCVGYLYDYPQPAIDESVTGTLTIPSEVEGYRVISIGDGAFFRNNLSEIILPETILKIDEDAFRYSFELSSLTIPRNVSYIPNVAVFSECPKLREIIVDKKNLLYDSREDCNAVIYTPTNTLITGCGGTTIPRSVIAIAPQALMDSYGMKSLFIHKDLIDIGYMEDWGRSLSPFWGCPDLESIVVEEGNPYYASPNNCNAIIDMRNGELVLGCSQTIIPSEAKFITQEAFFGNKKLTSIDIPENITIILDQAFTDCSNLEEVTLPSTLTHIGLNAFSQCNLKSIHIPDGIESLQGTFWENTNLSTFTGGNNLVEISNGTFSGCAFESFTLGDKVETIGDAFERCYNLKSIFIPKNVKNIGFQAFTECKSLESIQVDEENPVYDSRDNCNAIIETATGNMIAGCKTTTFPEGLKSINRNCFWDCKDLQELNFPNTLEEIGDYAFYLCLGLKKLVLPNSLKSLGNAAFLWCDNLTSVELPANLQSISDQAFSCARIEEVVCLSTTPPILSQNAFWYYTHFPHTLIVPDGCKAAYEAADNWKDFAEIKEMSERYILGDVNGNDGIDIGDAVTIVNYLVSKESETFIEEAADTNKNGKIDIGDAVTIVNYLVGKTASLSRKVDTDWNEQEPQ